MERFDPLGPLVTVFGCLPRRVRRLSSSLQCCNNKAGVVQAGVTKSNQKIYLAINYNSVMIALYLQG